MESIIEMRKNFKMEISMLLGGRKRKFTSFFIDAQDQQMVISGSMGLRKIKTCKVNSTQSQLISKSTQINH